MKDGSSCLNNHNSSFKKPYKGEEIVISGISGKFPDSHNVYQFRDNLFNKVDMVSGDYRRWKPIHPEVPQRTGKLYDIEKFDRGFFGVTQIQSDTLDPQTRLLLESVYEAIIDAGYSPTDFAGTNTAVVIGTCSSETEKIIYDDNQVSDAILGTQRSLMASRISYYLETKGPAFTVDTACSSSLYALQEGYSKLLEGKCDKVILAGSNLCLHPIVSLQFFRLGVLSLDGRCKSFDQFRNGYARSEGIVVTVLERAKDAKRIYAEILHSKTNCDGYKKEGITFPSSDAQNVLLKELYEEIEVDARTLTYVEAHGTGTKIGDPEELKTLEEVFCKGREIPLLIGSTKSSIGHNEPVSGLSAVVKTIIGMETGFIPPNIHYKRPLEGVESLATGRMVVVTEKTPLPDDRGLFGINSFGFGGANAHVLLHWNSKTKVNQGIPADNLPRLVCVHGRNNIAVTAILDDVKGRPLDVEYVYLIQQAFRKQIQNNLYRGFGIFTKQGEVIRSVTRIDIDKPKLYFVFNNFDTEFQKLGCRLTELPIFRNTFKSVLDDEANFVINHSEDVNATNQILETIALQINFVDMLKSIQLVPDQVVGIGSGELLAAYIDNYLTLKQTVLGLYCLALNLNEACYKNWDAVKSILRNRRNSYQQWMARDEKVINSVVLVVGSDVKQMPGKVLRLIDENSKDPIVDLLSNLGSLYEHGFEMELSMLYPSVELPVSRGTPMLSPLIKWEQSDCAVHYYKNEFDIQSTHRLMKIEPKSDDWNFVVDHVVNERNVFPGNGYLLLVWECLSIISSKHFSEMKIVFEDVRYMRASNIAKDGHLKLGVMIQTGTNNFEITEGAVLVSTGKVYEMTDEHAFSTIPLENIDESTLLMDERDIYKELKIRGYHYGGMFRSIKKCNLDATQALVKWESNWTIFTDCLLQMRILQYDTRSIYLPTSIGQLIIDAPKHIQACMKYDNMIPVHAYRRYNSIRTEGIELKDLIGTPVARRKAAEPVLEISKFIPNDDYRVITETIKIFAQIVLENTNTLMVKVVEACPPEFDKSKLLCPIMQKALDDLPSVQQEIIVLSDKMFELSRISVQHKSLATQSNCLMLIVNMILETTDTALAINAVIGVKGYIISREHLGTNLSKFNDSPFNVICSHTNIEDILVLLRPRVKEHSGNISYVNLTNALNDFQWVPKLEEQIQTNDKVVLYSQNDDVNGLLGFSTCLQSETSSSKIKSILIMDEAPEFDPALEFYQKQLDKDMAINVWKDGTWGTYRHLPLPEKQISETEHTYVKMATRGDLSTLIWSEGYLKPEELPIGYDKELIHVYYSALNFRDLMIASGKISPDVVTTDRMEQEYIQGFEFAGRNSKGERVVGMPITGGLASLVYCDSRFVCKIPDDWSMEDASTTFVAYSTILYAFYGRDLKIGKSILIHSGAGGIGLAAINLSLYYGLNIFVTVGTAEKREFLKKHYPQIKEEHIGNSRDTSFEAMVFQQTNGRGVDFVLNSLSEEKLLASVRCLARGGWFFDIGKFDLINNRALAVGLLEKDAHFVGVALDRYSQTYKFPKHILYNRFCDLAKKGAIKPLPRTIFKIDEIEQAFRFMGLGKHIGKVIIKIRDEEDGKICSGPRTLYKAVSRFFCDPSCSYLICGGLGGFGLELADLLVVRGAKNLVLTSKSGLCNGYQKYRIRIWESYGVNVVTTTLDASTEEGCVELLKTANELAPLDGIFNLAAILKDALFGDQTAESFKLPLIPKAHCTKNLDCMSRILCPNLRYFVVFSSTACGRGNVGQTNYGMANSIMERICEKRKREGYPALAIQWGAIGEVGLLAEMHQDHKELVIGGTLQQRISSCLQVMDKFLKQDEPIVGSMLIAEKRYGGRADNLLDAVLNILGISNLKAVSMHSPFSDMGMDSMMAIEVKQTLEREYEVFLTAQDIRGMTLAKLKDLSNTQETGSVAQNLVQTGPTDDVKLLLRHFGKEELSNEPVIKMRTAVEDDKDALRVLVLPGLEGLAVALESLCEKLKAHVSCLQYGPRSKTESIMQLASSILAYVEPITDDLIILAYSFGCLVAVELLHMLEAKGKHAIAIFIDGSPEIIVQYVKLHFPNENENLFQTDILSAIMMRYMPYEHILNLREQIMKLVTYQAKINYMVAVAPFEVQVPSEYITEMCIATYDKVRAIYEYKPREGKLKSRLTLIKASSNLLASAAFDYGLTNTFDNLDDILVVEGDHAKILENEELPKAINKVLGSF